MSENNKNRLNAVYGGGTLSTDFLKYAVDLTGAEKPKIAIAATPKQNIDTFNEYVTKWSERLREMGLQVRSLHEFGEEPNAEVIEWADMLNVSGGNTERMMHIWEQSGVDRKVRAAAYAGRLVMSGVSAGAIVGFTSGFSDSRSYTAAEDEPWDYIYVPGLELIENTIISPHFDKPDSSRLAHSNGRKGAFIDSISTDSTSTYLGIDNAAAISVIDGETSVFRVKPEAEVYDIKKHEDGSATVTPLRN